ncbi:VOC family protein [Segnochrobactrum spirostomi]|uniref:Glyoxalase n=1 Tax=Segnochrobactrum spirostomi TaxID=2608987 RepID=A0A6A7Y493_9HYPH|nr:VOC family protein [Segnochrobactrum spirostomi]MQT13953.1 glyoxalase [Segnochrobactrum spirostomi]
MTINAPPLHGILETALYVADLGAAAAFYIDVVGLPVLYRDERLAAFGVGGRDVLLLFLGGASSQEMHLPGGTIPPHDGAGRIHMAFAVGADDLAAWETRLTDAGVAIVGRTAWPSGGHSLYVRDPDGHLIEFATPGIWTFP